ncbi:hypothetical protein CYY_004788 [Polysphondylium violaceum]|uniref:Nucleolar protein 16 n=1 Tax=Polysphondylium violaceum TaxID=133409 RepID=A0A8J4PUP1_9MYCE|nr:hypothetical protein CYY_004788 [Polysphondylium violaceum]
MPLNKKLRKSGALKKKYNFGKADQEVQKRWDHSKTALENYSLMGLRFDNHKDDAGKKSLEKMGLKANPIQLTVPEEVKAKERGLSFHDQHYIRVLIMKYNDNYQRMKMDHKLNFYQKTDSELEKMAKRFIVLYGHPLNLDCKYQEPEAVETTTTTTKVVVEQKPLDDKKPKALEKKKVLQTKESTTTTKVLKNVDKEPKLVVKKKSIPPKKSK